MELFELLDIAPIGEEATIWAVMTNNEEAMRILLDKGYKSREIDSIHALKRGYIKILHILSEYNMPLNEEVIGLIYGLKCSS